MKLKPKEKIGKTFRSYAHQLCLFTLLLVLSAPCLPLFGAGAPVPHSPNAELGDFLFRDLDNYPDNTSDGYVYAGHPAILVKWKGINAADAANASQYDVVELLNND